MRRLKTLEHGTKLYITGTESSYEDIQSLWNNCSFFQGYFLQYFHVIFHKILYSGVFSQHCKLSLYSSRVVILDFIPLECSDFRPDTT